MSQRTDNYYSHLSTLNPNIENSYQSSKNYYCVEILPLLSGDKNARILDAGCGFGHLIRFLTDNGYNNTGGVEFDAKLYQHCCEYIGSKAIFIVNNDVRDYFKIEKQSFDAIISTDVIEHFKIEDALSLCKDYFKALCPGGRLILRTPNMANLFGTYSRYMDLTHLNAYTEHSLAQLLRQAGFSDPQLHLPNWNKHPLARKFKLSMMLQRLIFKLQDRSMPLCFDKNIIMWAVKP